MTEPQTLGALSTIHELLTRLIEDIPDTDIARRFHPDLEPLGWLLGRAVYLETYWLREIVQGDRELTQRVRDLFAYNAPPPVDHDPRLPPKDHLLNWAMEIQDAHLVQLANPGGLPQHLMLISGWLPAYLVQAQGRIYERMLAVVTTRALQAPVEYLVQNPLRPSPPGAEAQEVVQGHYRIGARDGVVFDNELPAQIVELSNYRIATLPVSNAEFFAFMVDGGYSDERLWSEEGLAWRATAQATHPWHWRQDSNDAWFGVSLRGAADLPANEPVMGISQHEANAYARWVNEQGAALQGAVVQHEYQWEVAARTNKIRGFGRAWEWCANPFEPYDQYTPHEDPELVTAALGSGAGALRGGCLHTQPSLRRASLRHWGDAHAQYLFAGTRLVLPPN